MAGDQFEEALAHHRGGRLEAAEAGYRRVLKKQPLHTGANNNLAILLRAGGQLDEAAACYRRAIESAPQDAALLSNLSCVLSDSGRLAEAAAMIRAALALKPDYAEGWFNLGNVLRNMRDRAGAQAVYRRAALVRPDMAEVYCSLGDLARDGGDDERAIQSYRMAMQLNPGLPQPIVNLSEVLREQGAIHEAIALLQAGMERHPAVPVMHANLLLAMHYTPWVPPEVIFRSHRLWAERHAPGPATPPRHPNDRTPDRPLRVGYVSPDFCAHACANFSLPLLRAHDPARVQVHCYATGDRADDTTAAFRATVPSWRSLHGLRDEAAAAVIAGDGIDILVDLAGHTAGGRLPIFARRPAPIQVTWLGYPDTTGLSSIDYRLTDAVADPEGVTDRWHSEKLVRLSGGFLSFAPLSAQAAAPDPPARAGGHVTFGSFNSAAKITPETVRLWSRLLHREPRSRLMLKNKALRQPAVRDRFVRMFADQGIGTDRLILAGPQGEVADHLRAYDGVDIALDSFPYNGTTTTCEALWMGVPVITLAGRTHVSRVSASILTQCRLTELIAGSEEEFLAVAAGLAGDLPRLAELRRGLPARLAACPLGDATAFARSVEAAYRDMWHRWLSQRS